ncbi:hypothetical protein JEQ12_015965 [Ovis aries]|uniref:Uncharacterized protein n=1 Tax=Ovis aries TaxID=9940 RepID=A0A836D486_SHEEP|nr:hypothetical protein JEQ12_015965 [Ovis aries]
MTLQQAGLENLNSRQGLAGSHPRALSRDVSQRRGGLGGSWPWGLHPYIPEAPADPGSGLSDLSWIDGRAQRGPGCSCGNQGTVQTLMHTELSHKRGGRSWRAALDDTTPGVSESRDRNVHRMLALSQDHGASDDRDRAEVSNPIEPLPKLPSPNSGRPSSERERASMKNASCKAAVGVCSGGWSVPHHPSCVVAGPCFCPTSIFPNQPVEQPEAWAGGDARAFVIPGRTWLCDWTCTCGPTSSTEAGRLSPISSASSPCSDEFTFSIASFSPHLKFHGLDRPTWMLCSIQIYQNSGSSEIVLSSAVNSDELYDENREAGAPEDVGSASLTLRRGPPLLAEAPVESPPPHRLTQRPGDPGLPEPQVWLGPSSSHRTEDAITGSGGPHSKQD